MTTCDYRKEFPDFDPTTMPELPAGFEDMSWHNDAMPWFFQRELRLGLWVDYADQALSEAPGGKRFSLYSVPVDDEGHADCSADEQRLLVETDDFAEVTACVALAREAKVVVDAGEDPFAIGLQDLFAANEDGLGADERGLIICALMKGEAYQGGGGAAGEWTVTLAPKAEA